MLRYADLKDRHIERVHLHAGNKLWEWVSFGRYGTGGYDVRKQVHDILFRSV